MQLQKIAFSLALCGLMIGCGKKYSGTASSDINNTDPTKRIEAIGRMSQLIGTESSALKVVLKGLTDSDESVQLVAADALGASMAEAGSIVNALQEALSSDASVKVKLRCVEALKKLCLSGTVSSEADTDKVKAIAKETMGASDMTLACAAGSLALSLGESSEAMSLLEKVVTAAAGKDSSSDEVKGAQVLLNALQEGNPSKALHPKIEALKATPNLNQDIANGLDELLNRLEGGGGDEAPPHDDLGPR